MLIYQVQYFRGEEMNIEFKTVFDEAINQQLAHLYVNYFLDKQKKQYKLMLVFAGIVAALSLITGIATENYGLCIVGPVYFLLSFLIVYKSKNKTIPKSFIENNKVGCPFNVTFGLYDEYFYEKFENNLLVSENSIRYEFLKKIVETPDCFVLMTKRSNLYHLPKRDMGYANALEFSTFCKNRLPYIYSFKN